MIKSMRSLSHIVIRHQFLNFDSGKDKRTDSFQVVFNNWLADVIVKRAVTRLAASRFESQPGDLATPRQRESARFIGSNKFVENTLITFQDSWRVTAREFATVDRFGERADKHRRGRSFSVI